MNILKYRVTLSFVLAAVLLVPSIALADAVSGPISNVAYDQQNPHTIYLIDQGVADGDGIKFGLWLTVWEDWRTRATTGADIRGQFIRHDGSFCGSEFIISNSSGNQTVPRASYRQDVSDATKSKVVVVWQDTRPSYVYFNALSNVNAAADCTFDSGTERSIGFNPARIYSSDTVSIGGPVTDTIGTGRLESPTGTTLVSQFTSGLSNSPVVPGTVQISVEGTVVLGDDMSGKIGDDGSILYNNGLIDVVLDPPPAVGELVEATYRYYNLTEAVTNELIDYGSGADSDFRGTLAIAPIVPGTLSVNVGGAATGIIDDGSGRLVPTITATAEPVAAGDGVAKTFTRSLAHHPVEKGTVMVKVGGINKCSDAGLKTGCTAVVDYDTGFVTALFTVAPATLAPITVDYKYYAGTVSYNTGVVSLSFASPPAGGDEISIDYTHRSFPPGKISNDDRLVARMQPRIAYDRSADRFWVVWKETRSMLHQLSEVCFAFTNPWITTWNFDDSDFIGYVRLAGNSLFEQNSVLDVAGADIIRNADTTTVRQVSSSFTIFDEVREYESFSLASNPDVACDDTSTQCLVVSEGRRTKQKLACTCVDKNFNLACDLADGMNITLESSLFDDGFVHIYGISDNYMTLPVYSSMKLDSGESFAHYPSVVFDPISKRFLTVWEDMRDGANTKIYGQLVLSGGGLYNENFIISYQNSDDTVLNSKQTKPSIAYDGVNQRFFVAWQDSRNSTLSLENLDIYGQKVDSEGSLRGNNYAIITQSASQYNPTMAYNELTNTYLASWKDARNLTKNTCTSSSSSGGSQPCGSDVYGTIFALGQPSITLLKTDDTTLTPPLLNCFSADGSSTTSCSQSVAVGEFVRQSFKIVNTGDTTLEIDYINETLACNGGSSISPYSFDGLPVELTASDGNTLNLVPGASLNLTVRFTPLAGGSYNKCFIIESNGGNPQVNISGFAVEPNITITPTPGSFGSVYVGNSADKTFTVKNTGFVDLVITTLDAPPVPYTVNSENCAGKTLSSGSTCTIVVRFSPSDVGPTDASAHFGINSNDPDTPTLDVLLTGTGEGAAAITVSPTSLPFGNVNVGQTSQKTITIRNDGTLDSLLISPFSTLSAPFRYVSNNCPLTPSNLAIGVSCEVVVEFAPTVGGGTSSSVVVTSNDPAPGKSPITVGLTGTGILAPVLSASPSPVAFGNQIVGATPVQKTVTVKNDGPAGSLLSITSVTPPSNPFKIISNTCTGATLASAASCTIIVTFVPPAYATYSPYNLTINSNDPVTPATKVALSGTGIKKPTISASPASLAFGNRTINTTSSKKTVTVKNTSSNSTLIISTVNIPAPFSATRNTCNGANLAYNRTCVIDVVFRPTSRVSYSTNLTINSNDSARPAATVALTGKGI